MNFDLTMMGDINQKIGAHEQFWIALYADASIAHEVAERLAASGTDTQHIVVAVSEAQLKSAVEAGVCIISPAEVKANRRGRQSVGA